ncbi:MAG: radical SAM protein, partial [Rhodospirillaceae bacterium]|nr:radical SAM protein [Rhodospirillaceae bacterium]
MSNSPAKAPYPKKITVALSDRCNLKCFICVREEYERNIGSKGHNMPLEDLYKMEAALRDAEIIQLSGFGETLLHPQLEEILHYIYSINPRKNLIYLISNGTLLNAKWAELLGPRLNYLALSLNAAHPETYKRDMYPYLFRYTRETAPEAYAGKRFADDDNIRQVPCQFDRTMSRVGEFMAALDDDARQRVGLHYVVHNDNMDEMADFVRLGKSVNATRVEFNQYMVNRIAHIDYNIFFHKERFNARVQAAKQVGAELGITVIGREFGTEPHQEFNPNKDCNWPNAEAMVMTKGDTPPCCHIGLGDMGNAIRHDFDDIWNGNAYQKLRRERWMSGCQSCNLFQTFDDWRSHFHPSVRFSPQFENLAGEMHEETRVNKPPKLLILGAGRDGTRSVANLVAGLHEANGQQATVHHDGGSFRGFSAVTKYLKGDDEWLQEVCRSWDADIVAGNTFNFALPVLHKVFGGDLKVIHVRRRRDDCLASLERAALADPLLWDGYVEVADRDAVAAPELYDPTRPAAPLLGEMDDGDWRAMSLAARLEWLYDASHRAIEENLGLFGNH